MAGSLASINIKFFADLKQFSTQMQSATRSMKKMGREMTDIGAKMSLGVTLPLLAIGAASIKAASDAEETASKFGVVFRDISAEAQKSADLLRNSYGLSSDASKKLLGDTGDLLTGFGFSQQSALDLSTEVNKLAVDLASFTNFSGGAEGASQALTKALLGERESVKALGIAILEEDVKARVLANTKNGLVFETERQAKAYATLQIAQEQSKNAIGDYARTSDSFANQLKTMKARLSDVSVEFGQILLPYALKLVKGIGDLTSKFSKLSPETKKTIIVVAGLLAVVGPLLVALGFMMTTVIPALITGYGGLAASVTWASGAFTKLTMAMAMNPLTALAGIIAVAVAAFVIFNKETEKAVKQQSLLGDVSDAAAKSIAGEKAKLTELLAIAQNEYLSKANRIKAIKELNKISPEFLGNLTLETINTNAAKTAVEKYNNELMRTARIKAAQEKLVEIASKQIDLELQNQKAKLAIDDLILKNSQQIAGHTVIEAGAKKEINRLTNLTNSAYDVSLAKLKAEEKILTDIIGKNILKNDVVTEGGGNGGKKAINVSTALMGMSPIIFGNKNLAKSDKMWKEINDSIKKGTELAGVGLEQAKVLFTDFQIAANEIITGAIADTFVNLGQVIGDAMANGGNVLQAAGKVIIASLGGILVQFGKLIIAAGIASETFSKMMKNPFGGGIAAIVAGVALVAIGSAVKSFGTKKSSSNSYADGGIVGGNSFYGDKLMAFLNSGETVLNRDQQKTLYNAIQPAGQNVNVGLNGEFRLNGQDLLLVVDRATTRKNRTS